MSKQFLTNNEVFVVKGYLSSDKDKVQPIGNKEFIEAQKHAEYVVTLANAAKGKDFKGKKADSISELKAEIAIALTKTRIKEYIKSPKKPSETLTGKLQTEALDFIKFQSESDKIEKVNKFLAQFSIIDEFEEVGLFFDSEIVKLNKIYTIKEIVSAVESASELFD